MVFYRWILIILGTISLILGIIGIFLPLLPTTPFLLLTAFLYFRSSPKAYNWLIGHKHLGPYIINYREKKIIPVRAKVLALTLMWLSILNCVIFLIDKTWVSILLLAIAVAVTIHILSFKSK
ncbi:MAG: YbaN family protein [Bacteroidales bacterium]|nr:YbaN family protein [Bacteroidales bacterium]